MADVAEDPVVTEMRRLLADPKHGTFSQLGRLAGVTPETVRGWASGTRPRKERWPAIEDYFGLDRGHLAKIANEAPPIVVNQPGGGVSVSLAQHVALAAKLEQLAARVEDLGAELERLKRAGGRGAR